MKKIFIIILFLGIIFPRVDDATCYDYLLTDNSFLLDADGYIGAIQMTLAHDENFSISLTNDALVADFRTENNQTVLIVVSPGSNEIFNYIGEIEISEMIVANSVGYLDYCPGLFVLSNEKYLINSFNIQGVYPNPFNPKVSISYSLNNNENIKIEIYDIRGKLISVLYNDLEIAGHHQIIWDASNYPSGLYFISIKNEIYQKTQKVILQK